MKTIRIRISELVFYQFDIEVEDDQVLDDESIATAAEEHFTQNGPKDEWVTGIEERDLEGWEEIDL